MSDRIGTHGEWTVARGEATSAAHCAAIFLFAAALLQFGWIGYLASDDAIYASGGIGWLTEFPYVGDHHGNIREPMAIPIALSFAIFGQNEFALVIPTLLAFMATLAVTYFALARRLGRHAGAAAALLVAATPLFAVQATVASADVNELFWLASAYWMFHAAADKARPRGLLIGAGAAVGVAFLTRETAVFAVAYFGVLFLLGYRLPRRLYWWMAAGFMLVVGLETAYLAAATGDPLYRIAMSMNHGEVNRAVGVEGNLLVHPFVDPLLVFLLNQEFGLLFWIATPAAIWLCFGRTVDPRWRTVARPLAGLALVWVACFYVAGSLLPLNPRYGSVATYAAGILAALAALQLAQRSRLAAVAVFGGLMGANLLCLALENREPLFGERALVAYVQSGGGPLTTDPETRHRAQLLLEWAGVADKVRAGPPRSGERYFYNPDRLDQPTSRRLRGEDVARYRPGPTWTAEWSVQGGGRAIGPVLAALRLDRLLPTSIAQKLSGSLDAVAVYRVSDDPGRAR